jgi:hypothetical protein
MAAQFIAEAIALALVMRGTLPASDLLEVIDALLLQLEQADAVLDPARATEVRHARERIGLFQARLAALPGSSRGCA